MKYGKVKKNTKIFKNKIRLFSSSFSELRNRINKISIMENLMKKFLYTGVGLVASTADKVQSNITETVEKTKTAQNEGEKVVTDLWKDTETKYNEMEARLRSALDSAMARFNLPNVEEFNALKNRVAELEAELVKKDTKALEAVTEKTADAAEEVKAAVKKAPARRRTAKKVAE